MGGSGEGDGEVAYRPPNFLDVPVEVTTFSGAVEALQKAVDLCGLVAAQHSILSNASGLVHSVVSTLFTRLLPVPIYNKVSLWCPEARPAHGVVIHALRLLQILSQHWTSSQTTMLQLGSAHGGKPWSNLTATGVVVAGVIAAITDCLLRQASSIAADVLVGRIGTGHYAPSLGHFASATATLTLLSPELCVARAGVLSYFTAAHEGLLEGHLIFRWDSGCTVFNARETLQFISEIAREVGLPVLPGSVQGYLAPTGAQEWAILQLMPELSAYRDVFFFFMHLLSGETYKGRGNGFLSFLSMRLNWSTTVSPTTTTIEVTSLEALPLRCESDGKQLHASYASPATYTAVGTRSEEDVIHLRTIPTFGGALSDSAAEALLSALTVPYLRIPLVLRFFAADDHVAALREPVLRHLLEGVLFEPGPFMDASTAASQIPAGAVESSATRHGLLLNELCRSPGGVLEPLSKLLRGALDLDTGTYANATATPILLFLTKIIAAVYGFVVFVDAQGTSLGATAEAMEEIAWHRKELRGHILGQLFPMLVKWRQEMESKRGDAGAAAERQGVVLDKQASLNERVVHEHVMILLRDIAVVQPTATALASAALFLTHHGKHFPRQDGEWLSEADVYEALTLQRRKLIGWLARQHGGTVSEVLNAVQHTATASRSRPPAIGDAQEWDWSYIAGAHGLGRLTHFKKSCPQEEDLKMLKDVAAQCGFSGWHESARYTAESDKTVQFCFQTFLFTFKAQRLQALPGWCTHSDYVRTIFGSAVEEMECATVESSPGIREWIRLVGHNHDVVLWTSKAKWEVLPGCTSRKFPKSIHESERGGEHEVWAWNLYRLVQGMCTIDKEHFDRFFGQGGGGKTGGGAKEKKDVRNPPAHLYLTGDYNKNQTTIVVDIVDPTTGMKAYEAHFLRDHQAVHVYCLQRYNARFYRTLVYSSDVRTAYVDMPVRRRSAWGTIARDLKFEGGLYWVDDATAKYTDPVVEQKPQRAQRQMAEQVCPRCGLDGHERPSILCFAAAHRWKFCEPGATLEFYTNEQCTVSETTVAPDITLMEHSFNPIMGVIGLVQPQGGGVMYIRERDVRGERVINPVGTGRRLGSEVITRDARAAGNLSGGQETFMPSQLLHGVVPQALIEKYSFWSDDAKGLLRGYPKKPPLPGKPADNVLVDLMHETHQGVPASQTSALIIRFASKERLSGWVAPGRNATDYESLLGGERQHALVDRLQEAMQRVRRKLVAKHMLGRQSIVAPESEETQEVLKSPTEDDDNRLKGALLAEVMAKVHGKKSRPVNALTLEEMDLVLLDLLHAPNESPLHRLAKMLMRIENLSHVLAWTDRIPGKGQRSLRFLYVQLPRLGLELVGKTVIGGALHLHLIDFPDLYVADDPVPEVVMNHLSGIPHGLIFQDKNHQYHILVPFVTCYRPSYADMPFSTDIIPERQNLWGSSPWRYFLYEVHTSLSFLKTPGTAATLYLMLLRALSRKYAELFSLCGTLNITEQLSETEARVLANIAKVLSPDIEDKRELQAWAADVDRLACLLKLAYQIRDAVEAQLTGDAEGFLKNFIDFASTAMREYIDAPSSKGSPECRLTPEEFVYWASVEGDGEETEADEEGPPDSLRTARGLTRANRVLIKKRALALARGEPNTSRLVLRSTTLPRDPLFNYLGDTTAFTAGGKPPNISLEHTFAREHAKPFGQSGMLGNIVDMYTSGDLGQNHIEKGCSQALLYFLFLYELLTGESVCKTNDETLDASTVLWIVTGLLGFVPYNMVKDEADKEQQSQTAAAWLTSVLIVLKHAPDSGQGLIAQVPWEPDRKGKAARLRTWDTKSNEEFKRFIEKLAAVLSRRVEEKKYGDPPKPSLTPAGSKSTATGLWDSVLLTRFSEVNVHSIMLAVKNPPAHIEARELRFFGADGTELPRPEFSKMETKAPPGTKIVMDGLLSGKKLEFTEAPVDAEGNRYGVAFDFIFKNPLPINLITVRVTPGDFWLSQAAFQAEGRMEPALQLSGMMDPGPDGLVEFRAFVGPRVGAPKELGLPRPLHYLGLLRRAMPLRSTTVPMRDVQPGKRVLLSAAGSKRGFLATLLGKDHGKASLEWAGPEQGGPPMEVAPEMTPEQWEGSHPSHALCMLHMLLRRSLPQPVQALSADQGFCGSLPEGGDTCELVHKTLTQLDHFAAKPLFAQTFVRDSVKFSTRKERGMHEMAETLSFDLKKKEAAKSSVAQGMLERLEKDAVIFGQKANTDRAPVLEGALGRSVEGLKELVMDVGAMDTEMKRMQNLLDELTSMNAMDVTFVESMHEVLLQLANAPAGWDKSVDLGLCRRLKQAAGRDVTAPFNHVVSSFAHAGRGVDLLKANRDLNPATFECIERVATLMILAVSRRVQGARARQAVSDLHRDLDDLSGLVNRYRLGSSDGKRKTEEEKKEEDKLINTCVVALAQKTGSVAQVLSAQRQYVDPSTKEFDQRFMLFEFTWNVLLRGMQVRIVGDFVRHVESGQPGYVKQMIMGAGKTTVVAPLLVMMLADGRRLIVQVVPGALLAFSCQVLQGTFSSMIPKQITQFQIDRVQPLGSALLQLFARTASNRGVIVTTPASVKTIFLRFIEGLERIEDPNRATPDVEVQHQTRRCQEVLQMWRESSVCMMDEVDLLLHPLKSELNFPVGRKTHLPLAPHRWNFVVHLIDAFFFFSEKRLSTAFREHPKAKDIMQELGDALNRGLRNGKLQDSPHLVLIDHEFYHSSLTSVLSKWAQLWLGQYVVGIDAETQIRFIEDRQERAKLGLQWDKEESEGTKRDSTSVRLLNLAHDWVQVFLPHLMSKVDRVSFGVLTDKEIRHALTVGSAQSRLALAIPFIGKDEPAPSSEYAHPEVMIGLTILAYRYEGLREADWEKLVQKLIARVESEVGVFAQRKTNKMFEAWIAVAGGRLLSGFTSQEEEEEEEKDATEGAREARREEWVEVVNAAVVAAAYALGTIAQITFAPEVVPLRMLGQSTQVERMKLFDLLRTTPEVLHWYLGEIVFPEFTQYQATKLSASGQELGSSVMFQTRIGFSGTPSDLLPDDLGQCRYEEGTDGELVCVLSDPQIMGFEKVANGWTVRGFLEHVATHDPPFCALIDTGAIITGFTNLQTVRFLLEKGLNDYTGCVFFEEGGKKMMLERAMWKVVKLSESTVPKHKRFTFYDQVHTTGIDVPQPANARAALTPSKDMTFRDFAQGAYRLRQIGQGQTICLMYVPEVYDLMLRETEGCGAEGTSVPECLTRTVAWLLLNSMRMERLQYHQLSMQKITNVFKKTAFNQLMRHHEKFSVTTATAIPEIAVTSVNVFREPVAFDVPDRVPQDTLFWEVLKRLVARSPLVRLPPLVKQVTCRTPRPDDGGPNPLRLLCNAIGVKLDGLQIAEVTPDGPAAKSGVEEGYTLTVLAHSGAKEFREELRVSADAAAAYLRVPVGEAFKTEFEGFMLDRVTAQLPLIDRILKQVEQEKETFSENHDVQIVQEQEQEKRPDEEVEEEKDEYVARAIDVVYNREDEDSVPWALGDLSADGMPPFHPFEKFHLHRKNPLAFPPGVFHSRNFHSPSWLGDRKVKRVVCYAEWLPRQPQLLDAPRSDYDPREANDVHRALDHISGGRAGGSLTRKEVADIMQIALGHSLSSQVPFRGVRPGMRVRLTPQGFASGEDVYSAEVIGRDYGKVYVRYPPPEDGGPPEWVPRE
eukprot:Hpha_TRINITY_DN15730_c3_g3::TRINITY_DN15730_c3_g3_i3::g.38070::m.38070